MTRVIQSVPELYTSEVVDLGGGAHEVHFYMRVIFVGEGPAGEWHYYGVTPPPERPEAVQHSATHFPAMLAMGTEGLSLLYDLAIDVERNALVA